jgi:hypothetical protein
VDVCWTTLTPRSFCFHQLNWFEAHFVAPNNRIQHAAVRQCAAVGNGRYSHHRSGISREPRACKIYAWQIPPVVLCSNGKSSSAATALCSIKPAKSIDQHWRLERYGGCRTTSSLSSVTNSSLSTNYLEYIQSASAGREFTGAP